MSDLHVEDIYRLSPLQEGLLFHSLYAPESEAYIVQFTCEVRGTLNITAFHRAWQRVVDRTPVLRTSFLWQEASKPVQVVHKSIDLPLEQLDWRHYSREQQQAELEAYLRADRRRGFDVTQAPLMRISLIQMADGAYQFTWTHHHLLLDGWSISLVLKDLFALYEAFARGQEVRLPSLRPYREYLAWLQRQDLGEAEAFWREELRGFAAPTPIRAGRVTAPVGDSLYADESLTLGEESTAALVSMARQHGLTLSTLFQGAWALLLHHYSGESDLLFGATVTGRPVDLLGANEMIGLFINTLPVRTQVEAGRPLVEWLTSLQARQAQVRRYDYSPLVQVHGWSEVPRGVPLFESLLLFENFPADQSVQSWNSEFAIPVARTTDRTNYALTVVTAPGKTMPIKIQYDTRRFEGPAVQRMLIHLRTLLEAMAAAPGATLGELSMLPAAEQQELLSVWNPAETAWDGSPLLHGLIEAQVERTPDAVAVSGEGASITYRELDRRANRLAAHLLGLGVGPEVVVGICMDRTPEMVVGLLAILKAGGAYVPLDPSYPKERLDQILQDAGIGVLLTEPHLTDLLPAHSARLVYPGDAAQANDGPVSSAVQAENLAYVLYTSGSTGRPKGVEIPHRAVVNFLRSMQQEPGMTASDTLLAVTTLAFDIAGLELFLPLISGAQVALASRETAVDPDRLLQTMAAIRPTVMQATPATWRMLVDAGWAGHPGLKILCGGEALPGDLAQALLAGGASLWNMYGPTETTIWSAVCRVELETEAGSTLPVGLPIANTQFYVLDSRMQPVPLGVAGELYIGGNGLARGYRNQPELTQERFIADPFTARAGARIYRTGDLVYRLPDGRLAFLGRTDHQVKLRGFRMELGEIEAALRLHPQVSQAVVLLREDQPGAKRLVGYLVATEAKPEASELRRFLLGILPEYMVPSAYVTLDALPLTPNGKVDRKALPAPETDGADSRSYTAPRTPVEELVAGIWADVLKVNRVGVDESFFDLGGHSLIATQLISRVRAAFDVDVPFHLLFERPTVAAMAEAIVAARAAGAGLSLPPIQAAVREERLPLSFSQQRLWFLDQMEPGTPSYNIPFAIRMKGPLDRVVLEQSLTEVIRRHESLRTYFAAADGQPYQIVAAPSAYRLAVTDLSAVPPEEQEEQVRRWVRAEANFSFDLAHGPLFRATLLALGPEEHLLHLNVHHIVADGWSIGVLMRELCALYESFRAERPSPLAELTVQYPDFAIWQQRSLKGEALDRQLAYWKEQLAGAPPVLELPTDRPRPAVQTLNGSRHLFRLDPELSRKLQALSRREGASLFMTLLAAFKVLMNRYSGQEDITVGTFIAGRVRAEIEGLIGFFVNTLALRTDLSGAPTFREVLRRVREVTLSGYSHQDVPFEQVLEAVQPERSLTQTPLFQVMFVLHNEPLGQLKLSEMELATLEGAADTARFDITLNMEETPDGLAGALEYNTDLFDASTIQRMAAHFTQLLSGIVADPAAGVATLPLLAEAERKRILVDWNETARELPPAESFVQLFEAQVARAPEAVAVVAGDEVLTYGELNRRANRLAHALRAHGAGPETVVGVCLDRTPELLVGLLGVAKSGAAWLPLDPDYPAEKLRFMLADTNARLVVSAGTDPLTDVEMIHPDQAGSDENPPPLATGENLVYVIYTSGSTGRPKGVLVRHRNLLAAYGAWAEAYRLHEIRTHLQTASYSFDVFNGDLVRALCSGGKLVLCPRETLLDGPALFNLIQQEQVEFAELVPSVIRVLAQQMETAGGNLQSLRVLVASSDSFYAADYEQIRRYCGPETRIIHSFGVTEVTIDSTYHEVSSRPLRAGGVIPIGRPFPNVRCYILDRQMQPVPPGVIGELFLGGIGVTRGYLNLPELTAQKFVADPFSPNPEATLYRTGDRARYLADGTIDFLGRNDFQVKLRGYRIELGEIETVLGGHPAVRQAVVALREDRPGFQQLVAYLVPKADHLDVADVRAYLAGLVPGFMVPSAFMVLQSLPLNANGKVDRLRLPAPDEQLASATGYVAPSGPIESAIATIWARILGREQIGVHDDFFALGGHSLMATQVLARVQSALGVTLPLRSLFENPTVAGMAKNVQAVQGAVGSAASLTAEGGAPLSFAQLRLWFMDQLNPGPLYNIPFAVRLTGQLDQSILQRSLSEVVRRHQVLRSTYQLQGDEPVQVTAPAEPIPFPLVDLSALPEAERQSVSLRMVEEEAGQTFDLAAGPVLRAKLLRLTDEEHIFLVTIHHIVADQWSMGLLVKEMAAIYGAFHRGQVSPLPEPQMQYAQYAALQRDRLKAGGLQQQLGFWKEQLEGLQTLQLPTDRPRPPVQTYRGAQREFRVSRAVTEALSERSRMEGVTLFMTLLAAFQALLQQWSGQDEITVGTPIANRNLAEAEEIIGFFVNMITLRTDLKGNPTFRELLARVREVTLSAYANQDVPFEQVVEAVRPVRDPSRSPLFQALFALQNAPVDRFALPGLAIEPLVAKGVVAKYDLSLVMGEADEYLAGVVEYNVDLFDESTIDRLIEQFQWLIAAAAAEPERTLGALTEPEARERTLVTWNQTGADYPHDLCIHQLFEAQVERSPDAVALISGHTRLTYQELNRRANQMAHHLQRLAIRPGMLVGFCLERTEVMLVTILAILKAGATYVPLDPEYPTDRLQFILEDTQVPLVITQRTLADRLPEYQATTLWLDDPGHQQRIAAEPTGNLQTGVTAHDGAYIIYTSGSTGRPKGVVIEHHSPVNLVFWARGVLQPEEFAGMLASTSVCFDLSIFEFFVPLSFGGKVILVENGLGLPAAPAANEVTLINTVPSMATALLQLEGFPASVRTICLAGEPLPLDLVQRLYTQTPAQRVLNLYGPSETTTYSTATEVPPSGPVTIGRPLANTQIYLLDEERQPVPLGAPGEIYIGGDGVARGYLNRPELTQERFVPDPFGTDPGARLYRTGDLARYRSDGDLIFLGRADHQIKVRGFRIEPGEIEVAMRKHPELEHVAVVVREYGAGDKRLIAYYTSNVEPAPTATALRRFLEGTLPRYMMPAYFVHLDQIPLTPNGKLDRKALPAPDLQENSDEVAPRTPTEEAIAGFCAELLRVQKVSVTDSLLEIGGDSLIATRLLSRIRFGMGVEISLRTFFAKPTVEALAAIVDESRQQEQVERVFHDEAAELLRELEHLSADQLQAMLDEMEDEAESDLPTIGAKGVHHGSDQ